MDGWSHGGSVGGSSSLDRVLRIAKSILGSEGVSSRGCWIPRHQRLFPFRSRKGRMRCRVPSIPCSCSGSGRHRAACWRLLRHNSNLKWAASAGQLHAQASEFGPRAGNFRSHIRLGAAEKPSWGLSRDRFNLLPWFWRTAKDKLVHLHQRRASKSCTTASRLRISLP